MFEYEYIEKQEDIRTHIQNCEGNHTQQAIYSTFHDALTQVCYGCMKVRSTIYRDYRKRNYENPMQATN
jgi:hypothetical protein